MFYLQKDNIRNQRENIVLSLANAQTRLKIPSGTDPVGTFALRHILYENISIISPRSNVAHVICFKYDLHMQLFGEFFYLIVILSKE